MQSRHESRDFSLWHTSFACYTTGMKIQWTKVTWYSQIIAIILFVGIFFLGMWIGEKSGASICQALGIHTAQTK